jgi:16S rRNA (guanine527-N7)-methyltransferase
LRSADSLTVARMIAALVDRYALPEGAEDQLGSLLALLVADPLAPTSVDEPARAVDDHLADSLVALELVEVRGASSIADLGAGAGLPGLPLAIALPESDVAVIESSARKCSFMGRAAAACGLCNTTVVNTRAESWTGGFVRFDLVTARALAPLGVVAEYAAPLLTVGGTLVIWRGRRDPDAEAAAARAAAILGLEVGEIRPVHPYAEARHRHLHLMSKVMDTPSEFPRRPGMAMKRPLGTRARVSDRSRR